MSYIEDSDLSTMLFDQLGLKNPFKVYANSDPGQQIEKYAWIMHGKMYANALELLELQLRYKTTEEKELIAEALEKEKNLRQKDNWQELIKAIIKACALSEKNEIKNWSKCNKAIQLFCLNKAELFGFSLFMAKKKNIEGALNGMTRLLKLNEVSTKETISEVCAEFIKFASQGEPQSDKNSSSETWLKDIKLHSAFANLLSTISEAEADKHDNNTSRLSTKIITKFEEIKISHQNKPEDVTTQSWKLLQDIAYCSIETDSPDFILVESYSLPRSGHYYLKSLLKTATNGKFSYCESYQEPGCCKSNPCGVNSYWHHARNKHENHLRLIKSHDFLLKDKTFNCMPGMFRIIQLREPFDLIISWLELAQLETNKDLLKEKNIDILRIYLYHEASLLEESWEIIDKYGTTMSDTETSQWLSSKKKYIKSFLLKWIPISNTISTKELHNCGNFVLHYQDMKDPQALLNLLRIKKYDRTKLATFKSTRENTMKRKSTLITDLVEMNSELIQEISHEIKISTPLLADGSNTWTSVTEPKK